MDSALGLVIMHDDINWFQLADYVSGRATLPERTEFEAWMAAAPERRRLVEGLQRVCSYAGELRGPINDVDVRRAWAAIAPRLEARRAVVPLRHSTRRPLVGVSRAVRTRRVHALGAAAVVLAVGAVAVFAMARRVAPGRATAAAAMRDVATGRGQRAVLRLDDGTRVVLGVASRLQWGELSRASARDVYLDGEALFTVVHDSRHPFRVHVHGAVMEDLGTEFSVHGYPDDERVVVVVKSGRVSLAPAADASVRGLVLDSGDLGTLSAAGATTVQHGVDVDRYQAFADGRLVLVDTPLAEAIMRLQRWYDVRIVVQDPSLKGATITASFHEEGIGEALRALSASLDARYDRRGDTVWLRAK